MLINKLWCLALFLEAASNCDDEWMFQAPAFLGGLALDSDGNTPYGNNVFDTLYEAQVACTELGDGCGGLTGFYKNGVPKYNLRRGTEFNTSPNSEFSYLKPKKQCADEKG